MQTLDWKPLMIGHGITPHTKWNDAFASVFCWNKIIVIHTTTSSTVCTIKSWNQNKLALGRPQISLNAAPNITHSAIASQDSSPVTMTFNAYCIVHYVVEHFNLNFGNHDAKLVRYRTVLCAWYYMQERNDSDHGTATGARVHGTTKIVWEYHELWLQEVVLLEKTMELHKPKWQYSIRSVPALGPFLIFNNWWFKYTTPVPMSVLTTCIITKCKLPGKF